MRNLVLVAIGGGVGSVVRYSVAAWCQARWASVTFPLATAIVNIVGCLLIGIVMQLAETQRISAGNKLLIVTGFLGGLTTFSTFGFDTWRCWYTAGWRWGLFNVGVNVVLGLLAVALGVTLARWLGGATPTT